MTAATSRQTKLTLRLDQRLIEDAKAYASEHGRSVSQLVAEYFVALAPASRQKAATPQDWKDELDPLTRKLVGAAVPKTGDRMPDVEDYRAHLRRKHLGGSGGK
jgi:hypothetical protein